MALFLLSGDEPADSHMSLPGGGRGTGRDGGKCGETAAASAFVNVSALAGEQRPGAVRFGFAAQFVDTVDTSSGGFVKVQILNATYRMDVVDGGFIRAGYATSTRQSDRALRAGRWYYLEAYVRPGGAGEGRFTVRVDGEDWVDIADLMLGVPQFGTHPIPGVLTIGAPEGGSLLVDDFYLDTDPDSSDWLGDISVVRLPVESVESNSGWDVDAAAGVLSGGDPGDAAELRFGPVPGGVVRASAVYGLVRAESPGPVGLSVSLPGGVPVSRVPGDSARGLVASVLGDGGPVGRFEVVA